VKRAVVMQRRQVGADEADRLLDASGGSLRIAVSSPKFPR
jgi:N-acetylmuramic acid 6-phosphate (MurNAc-6-P) etherase